MSVTKSENIHPASMTSYNTCGCDDRRLVKYVCEDDNVLFCRSCKNDLHTRCKLKKISEAAQGIFESDDFKQTTNELESLKTVFVKMRQNKRLSDLQHRQERKAICEFNQRGRNSRRSVHKGRTRLYSETGSQDGDIDPETRSLSFKCKHIAERITEYSNKLKECESTHDEDRAFIIHNKAVTDLDQIRSFLNSINEQTPADPYPNFPPSAFHHFEPENQGNVKVSRSMDALIKLPTIKLADRQMSKQTTITFKSDKTRSSDIKKDRRSPHGARLNSGRNRFRPMFRPQTIRMATVLSSIQGGTASKAFLKTSAMHASRLVSTFPTESIDISSNSPKLPKENLITAIVYFKDRRFAFLDCRHNRVKLFSFDQRYLCEIALHCSVWDCTVKDKILLVTCPAEGKIQRVQVTSNNRLFEAGAILTQKDCRGIRHHNDRIYVTYTGLNPCIKILSGDGVVHRSISAVQNKVKIFQNPLYLVVSRKGHLIYLSDFTLQRIIVIDPKGRVRATQDLSPNWPLGLASDKDDNVIVAVTGGNDIRLVASGGGAMKTLIDARKLDGDPCSVMSRQGFDGQKLYVAFSGRNVVKVFKLLY